MSNLETRPDEVALCPPAAEDAERRVEVLGARDVPLGGPRAMTVRRTLPQRGRSLIGAWCFADHYGPDDVAATGGMDVAPHPHTGLQTASWLFEGEIEHRDSNGVVGPVRPGELNLMTGGHGICHSEVSTPETATLHGVQLWIALPDAARDTARDFAHYVPPATPVPGGSVRTFLGTLAGATSPVPTHSPLVGAEVLVEPAARVRLDLRPDFEHGVLVDAGPVGVRPEGGSAGTVERAALGYLAVGTSAVELAAPTDAPARVLVLGGTPFGEEIVMWWNFVARSHEEIVAFRADWEAGTDRFGAVTGYPGDRLPAPALPHARIRPRR
ncbi:hypothetical protein FHX74_003038 [Friedmanniella endophytica]|uniref:Pirin n=1 Tax=Microlunatus kandeliicorticis TaxID=1759536 RepID=A0A7W3P6X5_9ACTN|nr:pirin family protein [Microlunatus kandeliicorticis]MBA8795402.1 hypothetical protein [Microlunatus kandeliicorticis]